MQRTLLFLLFSSLIVACTDSSDSPEPSNTAPVAINADTSASANNELTGQLSATDAENDALTFSLVTAAGKGTVTVKNDGSFSYTAFANVTGEDSFSFTANDGTSDSNVATVNISIILAEICLNTQATLLIDQIGTIDLVSAKLTTAGDTEQVAGFLVEMGSIAGVVSAATAKTYVEAQIAGLSYSLSSISQSKTTTTADSLSIQYSLSSSIATPPLTLAGQILQAVTNTIFTLPAADVAAPTSLAYRIVMSVSYYTDGKVVFVFGLVPANIFGDFDSLLVSNADGGNIAPCGSILVSHLDSFPAVAPTANLADFLFVIDNSGSMTEEQAAVSQAASDFVTTMASSNLDYQMGVITTDSDLLRGVGFTNDTAQFQTDIVAGINGSVSETGIWFAEQALSTIANGQAFDGTVAAAGYPRAGASMSVIILSDEPSQYTIRSGGLVFDPNNNLFLDNGYRVYSIIAEQFNLTSQYDDLSLASGGSVAGILNTLAFPAIMEQIAINAGGSSSTYMLNATPVSSSIKVFVDNTPVTRSSTDGWQYVPLSNSIVFYGTAIPAEGATITVDYLVISN